MHVCADVMQDSELSIGNPINFSLDEEDERRPAPFEGPSQTGYDSDDERETEGAILRPAAAGGFARGRGDGFARGFGGGGGCGRDSDPGTTDPEGRPPMHLRRSFGQGSPRQRGAQSSPSHAPFSRIVTQVAVWPERSRS
jgi:hypothetical protein